VSFVPVLQYGLGLGFFGFIYWLMDGILDIIKEANVHETGTIYDFLLYLWAGCLIVYIIFGGWWMIRKYNEDQYTTGGMM